MLFIEDLLRDYMGKRTQFWSRGLQPTIEAIKSKLDEDRRGTKDAVVDVLKKEADNLKWEVWRLRLASNMSVPMSKHVPEFVSML